MKISGSPPPDPGRLAREQAYAGKVAGASSGGTAGLEPGLLLKGRVIAADGNGALTVLTERGTFRAAATVALEVGREFWFEAAGGNQTPLALAGKANVAFELLRLLLPELLSAGESGAFTTSDLGGAKTPLGGLPWAEGAVDAVPNPLRLLRFVSQLGLLGPSGAETQGGVSRPAEAVNLVKGLLEASDPALSRLGRMVEAHAQLNQQPPASGTGNYWLFPVFFAEQAGRGEWMFSQEQSSGNDAGPVSSLSFYLAMSRLGSVHLSLAARPGRMTGVFALATPEAASHLRQHLPDLRRALEPLAGGQVDISCRCSPAGSFQALKEELSAKAGRLASFSLVDVRA
ncbi:MAG: flagellar hook-length control protein FliK [Desulfobacteraceae bacterium]|nr:flagellar hook-length control protein FliK [Desulfobacteraceae bacterium]